jgi:hypothetical protein
MAAAMMSLMSFADSGGNDVCHTTRCWSGFEDPLKVRVNWMSI